MLIKQEFPLSEIFYYKLANTAKFVLEVQSKDDLLEAINFVKEKGFFDQKKFVIAGSGSNLIFRDEYYNGAVIHLLPQGYSSRIHIDNDDKTMIHVFAGEQMDTLIKFAFENRLSGLEWAGGLPGSVGGAVRGNAGAFGEEIKDNLYNATVLDTSGRNVIEKTLNNIELDFSYRQSLIKSRGNMIVADAVFKLKQCGEEELSKSREKYENHIEFRKKNHPMEYPSCGSVFKNIIDPLNIERIANVWPDVKDLVVQRWHGKVPIGYVNKRLKLSGLRFGDVQVSEKHSNFIVNLGDGKSSDVIRLIDEIKSRIYKAFGFVPETEVEVV